MAEKHVSPQDAGYKEPASLMSIIVGAYIVLSTVVVSITFLNRASRTCHHDVEPIAINENEHYDCVEQDLESVDFLDEPATPTSSDFSYVTPDDSSENDMDIYRACVETLRKWDSSHAAHDISAFDDLYWDTVKYYQSIYSLSQIIESKRKLFNKYPEFYQYIDDVVVEPYNDEITWVRFTKYVRTERDGEFTSYPSYLVFNGESILEESDDITDRNLERKRAKNPPVTIPVNNAMTLDEIFCKANVGKALSVSYWDLVGFGNEEGPLAKAMSDCLGEVSLRCSMDGQIRNGGNGIYLCDGIWSIAEGYFYLIWKYDSNTKQLTTI